MGAPDAGKRLSGGGGVMRYPCVMACKIIVHSIKIWDNIFIGNHAAGSDRYGYWFDTQEHSINGSFNPQICPVNEKLGEFRDNETHSNGRYGLRIFHKLRPRQRPCDPWIFNPDMSLPNAPYPDNPSVPARFYNLVSWKNGRAGAIGEEMGAVEWHNFKVADNI